MLMITWRPEELLFFFFPLLALAGSAAGGASEPLGLGLSRGTGFGKSVLVLRGLPTSGSLRGSDRLDTAASASASRWSCISLFARRAWACRQCGVPMFLVLLFLR